MQKYLANKITLIHTVSLHQIQHCVISSFPRSQDSVQGKEI